MKYAKQDQWQWPGQAPQKRVAAYALLSLFCVLPCIPASSGATSADSLYAERNSLTALIAEHDAKCAQVPDDNTSLIQTCENEKNQIEARIQAYQTALNDFNKLQSVQDNIDPSVEELISGLTVMANRLHWSFKKQTHLNDELHQLDLDSAHKWDPVESYHAWEAIRLRGDDADLRREASLGSGPSLFQAGAGQQTKFDDCAVFALA
ncbi:MAG: hypothetical protein KGQ42_09140, partial [Alphaproteobacteria bacterium]|nr:hypothetical protein [Alphaproteobacteria bacterium]